MKPYLTTDAATLYHARAEEVYPHLDPGSVAMVWSDGPYAMNKAEWDRMGVDGLADWYAPHVEAWGRVCAPSATVYLWNTAEGWARIDPVMRAAGWTFRVLLTWLKTNPPSQKGQEALTCWADFTEVCGVYQRNAWELDTCAGEMIAHAAGRDDRNWIREWLCTEWDEAGLTRRAADEAMGTNGMAGRHYFGRSQWELPTWERYQTLATCAQRDGAPRARPYLVHPKVWPDGGLRASYDHLRAEYDHLRAEYDHLRAEYEAARVPFTAPTGHVGNVWTAPMVPPSRRLVSPDGQTHECEKPLAFAERAVRASTRVGDTILDPFAGTNRIALACHHLPEEERRHAIGIEMDRRWLEAIRPALVADHTAGLPKGQAALFGRAA